MEETVRKQLLSSNPMPPDEDKEQVCWPYCYQVDVLKDDLEELDESHQRLQKDLKDKTRVTTDDDSRFFCSPAIFLTHS